MQLRGSIIHKQTAKAEERETVRHADFVTTHLNSPKLLSPKQKPSTGVSHDLQQDNHGTSAEQMGGQSPQRRA